MLIFSAIEVSDTKYLPSYVYIQVSDGKLLTFAIEDAKAVVAKLPIAYDSSDLRFQPNGQTPSAKPVIPPEQTVHYYCYSIPDDWDSP
jgi:hypothetical protein